MNRALVWGLGKSGFASAKLLYQSGWRVTVIDRNCHGELTDRQSLLQSWGIDVYLGTDPTPDLVQKLDPKITIVSPGIPWDHPLLLWARQWGINTMGEVELAWQYLQNVPWVGVTGTNGKTTTTALIGAIFRQSGYDAPCGGNIGVPLCEVALSSPDWVIAELSSYQIESSTSVRPQIGVWTTFTPDHLSRHGTIERYGAIKASLLHQSQIQVLNRDDPYLAQHQALFPRAVWTSTSSFEAGKLPDAYIEEGWVYFRGEPILPLSQWKLLGNHNQQNLLLAVATARLAEIGADVIAEAVAEFRGIPHRLEPIGCWHGALWINDSKATNYDAALTGLGAVEAPVLLICGGEAKAGDPQAWLELIKRRVVHVLLIGIAADLFAQFFTDIGFSAFTIVYDLDHAVDRAAAMVVEQKVKSVLFSPACASFDQYANFEERGDHFRQLCQEISHG